MMKKMYRGLLSLAMLLAFSNAHAQTLTLPEPELPKVEAYAPEGIKDGTARAGQGDPAAMYRLGYMSHYGINVPQDDRKAAVWMAKASEAGDPNGMVALARFYKKGLGVAADFSRAVDLFNKAAQKQSGLAYYELGLLYEEGQNGEGRGVFQSYEKAIKLFNKAGDTGVLQGYLKVAQYYHQGLGVQRDLQKAIFFYTKVAGGSDESLKRDYSLLLSQLYMELGSEEKNKEEAIKWIIKAAETGDTKAQIAAGQAYLNGQGIAPDEAKARYWFEQAAAHDSPEAIVSLAYIYANGVGVDVDYKKAFGYYSHAAELGNSEAAWNLGNFYTNGYGVPADAAKAKEWFARSQALGSRQPVPGGAQ